MFTASNYVYVCRLHQPTTVTNGRPESPRVTNGVCDESETAAFVPAGSEDQPRTVSASQKLPLSAHDLDLASDASSQEGLTCHDGDVLNGNYLSSGEDQTTSPLIPISQSSEQSVHKPVTVDSNETQTTTKQCIVSNDEKVQSLAAAAAASDRKTITEAVTHTVDSEVFKFDETVCDEGDVTLSEPSDKTVQNDKQASSVPVSAESVITDDMTEIPIAGVGALKDASADTSLFPTDETGKAAFPAEKVEIIPASKEVGRHNEHAFEDSTEKLPPCVISTEKPVIPASKEVGRHDEHVFKDLTQKLLPRIISTEKPMQQQEETAEDLMEKLPGTVDYEDTDEVVESSSITKELPTDEAVIDEVAADEADASGDAVSILPMSKHTPREVVVYPQIASDGERAVAGVVGPETQLSDVSQAPEYASVTSSGQMDLQQDVDMGTSRSIGDRVVDGDRTVPRQEVIGVMPAGDVSTPGESVPCDDERADISARHKGETRQAEIMAEAAVSDGAADIEDSTMDSGESDLTKTLGKKDLSVGLPKYDHYVGVDGLGGDMDKVDGVDDEDEDDLGQHDGDIGKLDSAADDADDDTTSLQVAPRSVKMHEIAKSRQSGSTTATVVCARPSRGSAKRASKTASPGDLPEVTCDDVFDEEKEHDGKEPSTGLGVNENLTDVMEDQRQPDDHGRARKDASRKKEHVPSPSDETIPSLATISETAVRPGTVNMDDTQQVVEAGKSSTGIAVNESRSIIPHPEEENTRDVNTSDIDVADGDRTVLSRLSEEHAAGKISYLTGTAAGDVPDLHGSLVAETRGDAVTIPQQSVVERSESGRVQQQQLESRHTDAGLTVLRPWEIRQQTDADDDKKFDADEHPRVTGVTGDGRSRPTDAADSVRSVSKAVKTGLMAVVAAPYVAGMVIADALRSDSSPTPLSHTRSDQHRVEMTGTSTEDQQRRPAESEYDASPSSESLAAADRLHISKPDVPSQPAKDTVRQLDSEDGRRDKAADTAATTVKLTTFINADAALMDTSAAPQQTSDTSEVKFQQPLSGQTSVIAGSEQPASSEIHDDRLSQSYVKMEPLMPIVASTEPSEITVTSSVPSVVSTQPVTSTLDSMPFTAASTQLYTQTTHSTAPEPTAVIAQSSLSTVVSVQPVATSSVQPVELKEDTAKKDEAWTDDVSKDDSERDVAKRVDQKHAQDVRESRDVEHLSNVIQFAVKAPLSEDTGKDEVQRIDVAGSPVTLPTVTSSLPSETTSSTAASARLTKVLGLDSTEIPAETVPTSLPSIASTAAPSASAAGTETTSSAITLNQSLIVTAQPATPAVPSSEQFSQTLKSTLPSEESTAPPTPISAPAASIQALTTTTTTTTHHIPSHVLSTQASTIMSIESPTSPVETSRATLPAVQSIQSSSITEVSVSAGEVRQPLDTSASRQVCAQTAQATLPPVATSVPMQAIDTIVSAGQLSRHDVESTVPSKDTPQVTLQTVALTAPSLPPTDSSLSSVALSQPLMVTAHSPTPSVVSKEVPPSVQPTEPSIELIHPVPMQAMDTSVSAGQLSRYDVDSTVPLMETQQATLQTVAVTAPSVPPTDSSLSSVALSQPLSVTAHSPTPSVASKEIAPSVQPTEPSKEPVQPLPMQTTDTIVSTEETLQATLQTVALTAPSLPPTDSSLSSMALRQPLMVTAHSPTPSVVSKEIAPVVEPTEPSKEPVPMQTTDTIASAGQLSWHDVDSNVPSKETPQASLQTVALTAPSVPPTDSSLSSVALSQPLLVTAHSPTPVVASKEIAPSVQPTEPSKEAVQPIPSTAALTELSSEAEQGVPLTQPFTVTTEAVVTSAASTQAFVPVGPVSSLVDSSQATLSTTSTVATASSTSSAGMLEEGSGLSVAASTRGRQVTSQSTVPSVESDITPHLKPSIEPSEVSQLSQIPVSEETGDGFIVNETASLQDGQTDGLPVDSSNATSPSLVSQELLSEENKTEVDDETSEQLQHYKQRVVTDTGRSSTALMELDEERSELSNDQAENMSGRVQPENQLRDSAPSSLAGSVKTAVQVGLLGLVGAPVLAGKAIADALRSKPEEGQGVQTTRSVQDLSTDDVIVSRRELEPADNDFKRHKVRLQETDVDSDITALHTGVASSDQTSASPVIVSSDAHTDHKYIDTQAAFPPIDNRDTDGDRRKLQEVGKEVRDEPEIGANQPVVAEELQNDFGRGIQSTSLPGLSLSEALLSPLYDQQHNCFIDPTSGRRISIALAIQLGLIDGNKKVIADLSSGEVISVLEALSRGIIDSETGMVSVDGEACVPLNEALASGLIMDDTDGDLLEMAASIGTGGGRVWNEETDIGESQRSDGTLRQSLRQPSRPMKLVQLLDLGLYNPVSGEFRDPRSSDSLSMADAIRYHLLDKNSMVINDPQSEEVLSLEESIRGGLVSGSTSLVHDTSTSEKIPLTEALRRDIVIPRPMSIATAINIGLYDESNGMFFDPTNGVYFALEEAVEGGLIDPHSLVIDPATGKAMAVAAALACGVLDARHGNVVNIHTGEVIPLKQMAVSSQAVFGGQPVGVSSQTTGAAADMEEVVKPTAGSDVRRISDSRTVGTSEQSNDVLVNAGDGLRTRDVREDEDQLLMASVKHDASKSMTITDDATDDAPNTCTDALLGDKMQQHIDHVAGSSDIPVHAQPSVRDEVTDDVMAAADDDAGNSRQATSETLQVELLHDQPTKRDTEAAAVHPVATLSETPVSDESDRTPASVMSLVAPVHVEFTPAQDQDVIRPRTSPGEQNIQQLHEGKHIETKPAAGELPTTDDWKKIDSTRGDMSEDDKEKDSGVRRDSDVVESQDDVLQPSRSVQVEVKTLPGDELKKDTAKKDEAWRDDESKGDSEKDVAERVDQKHAENVPESRDIAVDVGSQDDVLQPSSSVQVEVKTLPFDELKKDTAKKDEAWTDDVSKGDSEKDVPKRVDQKHAQNVPEYGDVEHLSNVVQFAVKPPLSDDTGKDEVQRGSMDVADSPGQVQQLSGIIQVTMKSLPADDVTKAVMKKDEADVDDASEDYSKIAVPKKDDSQKVPANINELQDGMQQLSSIIHVSAEPLTCDDSTEDGLMEDTAPRDGVMKDRMKKDEIHKDAVDAGSHDDVQQLSSIIHVSAEPLTCDDGTEDGLMEDTAPRDGVMKDRTKKDETQKDAVDAGSHDDVQQLSSIIDISAEPLTCDDGTEDGLMEDTAPRDGIMKDRRKKDETQKDAVDVGSHDDEQQLSEIIQVEAITPPCDGSKRDDVTEDVVRREDIMKDTLAEKDVIIEDGAQAVVETHSDMQDLSSIIEVEAKTFPCDVSKGDDVEKDVVKFEDVTKDGAEKDVGAATVVVSRDDVQQLVAVKPLPRDESKRATSKKGDAEDISVPKGDSKKDVVKQDDAWKDATNAAASVDDVQHLSSIMQVEMKLLPVDVGKDASKQDDVSEGGEKKHKTAEDVDDIITSQEKVAVTKGYVDDAKAAQEGVTDDKQKLSYEVDAARQREAQVDADVVDRPLDVGQDLVAVDVQPQQQQKFVLDNEVLTEGKVVTREDEFVAEDGDSEQREKDAAAGRDAPVTTGIQVSCE